MAKTICLIDDDQDVLDSTTAVLEAEGYDVKSADNLEDSQNIIDSVSPDLIILDVMFPGDKQAGFDFCRKLRANESTKLIPLIMLSGINQEYPVKIDTDEEWLPADNFINKPVDPKVLLKKVAALTGS